MVFPLPILRCPSHVSDTGSPRRAGMAHLAKMAYYARMSRRVAAMLSLALPASGALGLFSLTAVQSAAQQPLPFAWNAEKQGGFVMSLVRDRQGRVWAGTEDKGVWCFDPFATRGNGWQQFTTEDGLGDNNAYALSVDSLGRVWAGHLNHGVSVYNGQEWHNYGVLQGALGERVYGLAPGAQGDMWIATSAGLTRYQAAQDRWQQFTPVDGLPSCDLSCVACAPDGTVYAGTQTDGIAIATPADNYQVWRVVRGPQNDALPLVPGGQGLPSNLINDLVVDESGAVYAATGTGLARSVDRGQKWSYVRGANWRAKAQGLRVPPQNALPADSGPLLREDYITRVAEDVSGRVWIGYRQKEFEVRQPNADPAQERILYAPPGGAGAAEDAIPFVSALLPLTSQYTLLAAYGEGVTLIEAPEQPALRPLPAIEKAPAVTPPLPSVAKAPDEGEFAALRAQVESVPPDGQKPVVAALPDDWNTQGDWLGRYGRYYARLCAMLSPRDYIWGGAPNPVVYSERVGLNARQNDSIRYWIQSLYTADPRTLEMTQSYYDSRRTQGLVPPTEDPNVEQNRRESEINDNGHTYPITAEGPSIYISMLLPKGTFTVSLYDFNKDGHTTDNWMRDYRVSVRSQPLTESISDLTSFETQPELAHARIRDFWGGVYKRFLVHNEDERRLTFEVSRNYSHNTMLSGVFVDELNEEPEPYFLNRTPEAPFQEQLFGEPVDAKTARAADALWHELELVKTRNAAWWGQNGRKAYARLAVWFNVVRGRTSKAAQPELNKRLGTCYAALALFPQWETMQNERGLTSARDIEKAIHWDGKSEYMGHAHDAIAQYVATHPPVPQQKQPQTATRP